jgi:hypothetical protein
MADIMRWYLKSEAVEVYACANQIFYKNDVPADIETGGLIHITFCKRRVCHHRLQLVSTGELAHLGRADLWRW